MVERDLLIPGQVGRLPSCVPVMLTVMILHAAIAGSPSLERMAVGK